MDVLIDRDSNTTPQGFAAINVGTSVSFLLAEPSGAKASCADIDGDGVAGFTRLDFLFKDMRSGDLVPAVVIPNSGEVDESGRQPVTIVIGNTTLAGTARIRLFQ